MSVKKNYQMAIPLHRSDLPLISSKYLLQKVQSSSRVRGKNIHCMKLFLKKCLMSIDMHFHKLDFDRNLKQRSFESI